MPLLHWLIPRVYGSAMLSICSEHKRKRLQEADSASPVQLLGLQSQSNTVAVNRNENDTDPTPGRFYGSVPRHLSSPINIDVELKREGNDVCAHLLTASLGLLCLGCLLIAHCTPPEW